MTKTNRRAEKKAQEERIAKAKAEAREHVARGTCPECGSVLVPNSALTGWWQCARYACDEFRLPAYKGLPSCHFQCFT